MNISRIISVISLSSHLKKQHLKVRIYCCRSEQILHVLLHNCGWKLLCRYLLLAISKIAKSSNGRCIFGPHCCPEIQCCLCDISQPSGLPNNDTTWKLILLGVILIYCLTLGKLIPIIIMRTTYSLWTTKHCWVIASLTFQKTHHGCQQCTSMVLQQMKHFDSDLTFIYLHDNLQDYHFKMWDI